MKDPKFLRKSDMVCRSEWRLLRELYHRTW
jgi:hypothetical protein